MVLVWLLFNVPVNNFSVMLGRVFTSTLESLKCFGELRVLTSTLEISRTLHGGRGVRTLELTMVNKGNIFWSFNYFVEYISETSKL